MKIVKGEVSGFTVYGVLSISNRELRFIPTWTTDRLAELIKGIIKEKGIPLDTGDLIIQPTETIVEFLNYEELRNTYPEFFL